MKTLGTMLIGVGSAIYGGGVRVVNVGLAVTRVGEHLSHRRWSRHPAEQSNAELDDRFPV